MVTRIEVEELKKNVSKAQGALLLIGIMSAVISVLVALDKLL
jgi:hypothetical protein